MKDKNKLMAYYQKELNKVHAKLKACTDDYEEARELINYGFYCNLILKDLEEVTNKEDLNVFFLRHSELLGGAEDEE